MNERARSSKTERRIYGERGAFMGTSSGGVCDVVL
jgi:hypothetical protein